MQLMYMDIRCNAGNYVLFKYEDFATGSLCWWKVEFNHSTNQIKYFLKDLIHSKAEADPPYMEIPVGVILDMGSWIGKTVHSYISMAVSEFYKANSHYKTRTIRILVENHCMPFLLMRCLIFYALKKPSFAVHILDIPTSTSMLDCKSYAHMLDMELVEKRNILVGDWMSSTKFTDEPKHEQV
ncbi:hypothetical protein L1987_64020 [Smallanthus sonchifolius]|uniref:Uncharacterized protein n=1 Tax=Smallanthus sonchifolius TaxID=185202 RepID=A0ACB9CER5_9ASTR|nr:hypothetical protein L1987_64020 [Smallanthus sonchifolius]